MHIELVPDLETATFIRALKRFISRRGFPNILISDNAKTFRSSLLRAYLLQNKIEHKFILPASPWWGGFYERLVRSVKLPLKKILGKARISYEEMETVLIDVEGVVNSRPLTYLYNDDVVEPLTPSHLLTGRNISKNSRTISKLNDTSQGLTKRARYLQEILKSFWVKFKQCYLAELREHHSYQNKLRKIDTDKSLHVEDVVIVKDDDFAPRGSWRMGRVDSLITW